MSLFSVCLLLLLGPTGCSDVPATNPYDPSTPAAQQARGTLEGRVALPTGYAAELFDGASVELRRADAPAQVARTAALSTLADMTPPTGRFNFADLTAGVYLTRVQVPGLTVPVQTVEMTRGGRVDLGTLVAETAGGAFIEGVATLAGPAITNHGGILVSVPGTPATALTGEAGGFRIEVAPGPHRVRATYPGYEPAESADLEVLAQATTVLPEPWVLAGRPGAVAGQLRLLGGYAQDRVASAAIVLQTRAGDEVERTTPDAEGRFRLSPLAAGEYRLAASVEGFSAPPRDLTLGVGETMELGDVLLAPAEEGILLGRIELEGATDHAGTVVSLSGSPATSVTGPDGAFRLTVAAGNYTLHVLHRGYTHPPIADVTVVAGRQTALEAEYVMAGAPGSLEGTVGLPPGFDASSRLFMVSARVRREGEDTDTAIGSPSIDGRFLFEALPAGNYRVELALAGFTDAQASSVVPLGERVSIGHITLQPAAQDSAIVGRAELRGAAEHGGITVSVDGQPYQTTTTREGRYRLEVPSLAQGAYGVTYTKAGFSSEHRQVGPVPGGDVEVADTPILVGQPGHISGLVELDPRFADPALLARVSVRLERLEAGARIRVDQRAPDADGVFLFNDVPAGTYYLFAVLEGFIEGRAVLSLGVGEDASLPVMYLSPDEAGQAATIAGRVLRAGRADGEHGGIRVEAALSGYVTLTGANGDFELNVVANTYTLAFHADGYASDTAGPFVLAAQGRLTLPAPVRLQAQTGTVRGAVSVPEGFDANGRVDRVVLSLTRPADGMEFARVSPGADGQFVIADVPPGAWSLATTLPGFSASPMLLDVAPGELEDVHLIALTLAAQEAAALPLIRGRVELLGAGPQGHGGVQVEVQGTPFSTSTRSDGYFEVVATPGPATLVATRDRYVPLTWGPVAVGEADVVLPDPLQMLGEPGRLRGVVVLPPGFDPAQTAETAVRVSRDGEFVALVAPTVTGQYLAGALPAADYEVGFTLAGFEPISVPVTVEAGQTTNLGATLLQLVPRLASMSGVARLQGVVDDLNGHGGIRVEALGSPFTTLTAGDGSFQLSVQPRALTLVFRRDGYGTKTEALAAPRAGVDTPIEGFFVLSALPGRVHGTATLARFGTLDRLQDVAVSVVNARGVAVVQGNPGADGQFVLPGIEAGDYTVRLAGTGYETANLGVTVPVGGLVELANVDLTHKSAGPSAVVFGGVFTLAGASDHAGTLVRLRTANPDLPFAVTQTDAEGRFEVLAAPDETYRVSAHHAGFDEPVLDTPWQWDPLTHVFRDDNDTVLARTLVPSPLNGRVEVTLRISPDWVPVEQQYMRVRLRGLALDQMAPQVTEAAPQVFNNVPAGTYTLSIDRPGFTSVQIPLTLDLAHPTVVLGPVDVALVNLAAAQIDLSGRQLDACALRRAPVSFRGADLSGARFTGDFSAAGGAACAGCQICAAFDFTGTNLTNADFTGATSLAGVDFDTSVLFGARASGRNLTGASLNNANLFGVDLAGAQLGRADLRNANLTSAGLAGAGFVAANETLPQNPCGAGPRPSVQVGGAVFSQADLTGADLRGVDFRDASLGNAILRDARLQQACLRNADLTLINLADAVFDGADATGAQLTAAILDHTSMRGTELVGAVLTNAVIQDADLRPRPLANGQACTPYPWEQGQTTEAACVGNTRWTDARCCRTQLDGANLNGANLVGARLDDVDLSGTSLLGITLGDSDELPDVQPVDCLPERYNACLAGCEAINTCRLNVLVSGVAEIHTDLDCEAWATSCMRGVFDVGARRFSLTPDHPFADCIADGQTSGGCGVFIDGLSVCAGAVSPFPVGPAYCTFAQHRTNTCRNGDLEPAPCKTRATSLIGARLDRAQMTAVTLSRVHLKDALIRDAFIRGAFAVDVVFDGANLTGSDLGRSELATAELRGVTLDNVNLQQSNLAFADLSETSLTGATLDDAELEQALFIGATAETPDNSTRAVSARRARLVGVDLTDAFLPGINLREADLSRARLRNTRLPGADLIGTVLTISEATCVDLTDTQLGEQNLADSQLRLLDLDGARIAAVNFRRSSISQTRFDHTDLLQSDFTGAVIFGNCQPPAGYTPLADLDCTGDPDGVSANCTTFAGSVIEQCVFRNANFAANLSDGTVFATSFDDDGAGTGRFQSVLAQRTAFYDSLIGFAAPHTPVAATYQVSSSNFTDACFVGGTFRYTSLRDADFIGTQTPRNAPVNPVCQRACINPDGTANQSCQLLSTQCIAGTQNCLTFDHADLVRTEFTNAYLVPARFDTPTGTNTTMTNTDFSRMTMVSPSLATLTATDTTFNNAVITNGAITGSTFTRPNFRSARLSGTDLTGTNFSGGDFTGATFTGCNMAGQFTSNGGRRADFTGGAFFEAVGNRRADLANVDFVNAILRNANFTQAWLFGALFDGVANRVDLTGATLNTANLNGATFRNVDLVGADVRGCNFQAATWNGVNFTNATMCLADYTWMTANLPVRCPGCTLTNVVRPVCALSCNLSDPCP